MALTKLPGFTLDNTGNFTFANANVTSNITSGNASLGNLITGNFFSGNGSLLTSITGANVSGYVPNASNANSATTAGTVTTASQPNITSLGSLSSLTVTGNITSGNISGGNLVTSNYISGNGSLLTSITGSNVTGYVTNSTNANNATTAGTVTTAAQPNITSVGTLSSLSVSGLITATGTGIKTANIQDSTGTITITTKYNNIAGDAGVYGNLTVGTSGTGNVIASYFSGNGSLLTGIAGSNVTGYVPNATTANTAGTVTTNAQPNITSVGTLSSLVVSGDATVTGNLTVNGNTEYTNVTNLYVKDPIIEMGGGANGAALTSNDGKDRGTLLHYYTTSTVDAFMGWDNSNSEFSFGSNVSVTNEVVTFNSFGNIRANYFIGNGSTLTSLTGSNVTGYVPTATTANTAGTVTTNAQPNITSVGTLSSLSTGTITTSANSNISMSGSLSQISGANLISGTYLTGTLTTAAQPNITSVGTLSSLTVTSNVSAGNLKTDNLLYANGTAWNLSGSYSNTNVASYLPTYTGNVSANYFIGNGATLTYITGANVTGYVPNATTANTAGTVTTNSQPNITSVGTLTGLTSTGTVNFTSASNVSLGTVANVRITGGAANYYLKTDGTGNLSWATVSGSGGSGITYTSATTPPATGNILGDQWFNTSSNVLYEYISDGTSSYWVDVQTPAQATTNVNQLYNNAGFVNRTYSGNGSTTNFTITTGLTVSSVLVTLDGVVQAPTSDYTVSGVTLTFTTAPYNGAVIQIRELGYAIPATTSLTGLTSLTITGNLAVTGNTTLTGNLTSTSMRAQAMTMGIIFGG